MIKAFKKDIDDFKKEIEENQTSKVIIRICGGLMIVIAVYWIYATWF